MNPTATSSVLLPVICAPFLYRSNAKAPTMVGMASQNENSAAERRSAPSSMAATMVAPARDTPGIMAAHWTMPMPRYIGSEKRGRVRVARLEVELVDPQQHGGADDQAEADDPRIEQDRS